MIEMDRALMGKVAPEDPCEPVGEGATGIVDQEGNVMDGSVENYDLNFESDETYEEEESREGLIL